MVRFVNQAIPQQSVDPALWLKRRFREPLVAMIVLALVTGFVAAQNLAQIDGVIKLCIASIFAIVALALVSYRPIVFPFAIYLFLVPFDALLQTGSGTITKFLAAASMGIVLLTIVDRRRLIAPPLVVALWGLFLAWNVASFIWSEDAFYQINLLNGTAQLFALLAIFSMVAIPWKDVKALLVAVVAGGVTCAAYGAYLFQQGSVSSGTASTRLTVALSKTQSINADHFSAALVFPFALAIVGALHLRGWQKIGAMLSALVLIVGIAASGTRGSLIAVGVIWLYLMIAYRHRIQLAILGAVCVAGSAAMPSVWMRFTDASQGEAGGRYSIWAIAWDAFRHHWLLGIGTGQFRLAYGESYIATATGRLVHPWAEDAHNLIASTAVELGIIGLLLVLGAWYAQFRLGTNIPRSSPMFHARIAVQAGTLGLFVNSLSVDMLFYKYLWIVFTIGVIVRNTWLFERAREISVINAESSEDQAPAGRPASRPAVLLSET